MQLTKNNWKNMLKNSCILLKEKADELSKMDAVIGDGDHGVSIHKIAVAIEEGIDEWEEKISLKIFLENLSCKIMDVNGGSAGPLWGNLFSGFSNGLSQDDQVDEQGIKKMFEAGLIAMQEITTAKVGDKTLMDSLIPAVEAIQNSGENIPTMLQEAATAAKQGAENTANYMAKFGRAKNLKEKSIGYRDPGAVSLALLFEGMARSFI